MIFRLAAEQLGEQLGVVAVRTPTLGLLDERGLILGDHSREGREEVGIGLGEGGGGDPGGERRRTLLGDFLRGDDHLAVLLQLGQRRVPDEAAVEVAAVVAGDDVGLRDCEHLHVLLGEAETLDQREQLIVVGRNGRGGEFLAFEIGERVDAGPIAHDQRFVGAGDRGEIEGLDVEAARGRRCVGARADVTDLHVARGDGGEDFGAGVEAAEIDLEAGRLFELAVSDGDRRRQRVCLVGDDDALVGGVSQGGAEHGERADRRGANQPSKFHVHRPRYARAMGALRSASSRASLPGLAAAKGKTARRAL